MHLNLVRFIVRVLLSESQWYTSTQTSAEYPPPPPSWSMHAYYATARGGFERTIYRQFAIPMDCLYSHIQFMLFYSIVTTLLENTSLAET